MQRTRFDTLPCPIARGLERVGDWWTMLILRDAFYGLTRFDEFEKSLKIAPNMLTRRLHSLVEDGLMERHPYSEKPPRFEYRLTQRGRDFRPVLLAMLAWGNRHFAPEGASVVLVDTETGKVAEPILVDARSGKTITEATHMVGTGPAANTVVRRRVAAAVERRKARKLPTRGV